MFTRCHDCKYWHSSLLPWHGAAVRDFRFGAELSFLDILKLTDRVAYEGSGLFSHHVTYLVYMTACRVVYAILLPYIDYICELAMTFICYARVLICNKIRLNIHGGNYSTLFSSKRLFESWEYHLFYR